jgi:hypothetical protein
VTYGSVSIDQVASLILSLLSVYMIVWNKITTTG